MTKQHTNRQFSEAQARHQKGDILGALRVYDALRRTEPFNATLSIYRALALLQLGRRAEAEQSAADGQAQLDRAGVPELSTLGIVWRHLGRFAEAETCFRQALERDPASAAVRNNLGLLLLQQRRWAQADAEFAIAMDVLKEDAAPALNRARIAMQQRDFELAETLLREAKDRQPGHTDIGAVEAELALDEADHPRAFKALMRTLDRMPTHLEAWSRLVRIEAAAVELEPFERLLKTLVRAKPTSARLLANAVSLARKHLAWGRLAELEAMLDAALLAERDATIEPSATFLLLSANISQQAHRVATHAGWRAYVGAAPGAERPAPRPLTGRSLRVGYLSSDLRGHAIGFLSVGVMEAHAHTDIEWIAYSNFGDDGSAIRQRMRPAFDRFVNVVGLDDAALAERIREDGIDVLVDLNGFTAENRLGVFRHRPAPVTVTWLGMPGTNGADDLIDYILLDPWVGHPGNLDGFDEQPVILAGSYQPNDAQRPDLSRARTRADWSLPESATVFCSFNQTQKFSPDTVALWARILREVPESVLWVLAGEPTIEERFLRIFGDAGIAPERILFAPRVDHDTHIARLSHADLMLDNWPYNAHTTCSDALRAGVPVLTLPGPTFASRVAAGILATANLADWIAADAEDYVAKAVAHGRRTPEERQALKDAIGETYWSSPMVDCRGFAARLEAFYRAAFERALAGEAPAPAWVSWPGEVHWGLPEAESWHATFGAPGERAAAPSPADPAATRSAPPRPAASAAGAGELRHGGAEARLHNLRLLRDQVLGMETAPLLVDVGAASFDWDPQLFDRIVDEGLLECLGFEPDPKTFKSLKARQAPNRLYVQKAVGDGLPGTLHLCNGSHMNSLLAPNAEVLIELMGYQTADVVETLSIDTVALDDVQLAERAAMIKLDTQGTELSILQHATRLLDSVAVLQFEAAMLPMYQGQPSLFTIGSWLEQRGFVMHSIAKQQKGHYFSPDSDLQLNTSQLLEVDAVFIPSPLSWGELRAERLLNLAFLMHALYRAHDAAMRALWTLDQRDGSQLARAYGVYLKEAGLDA